MGPMRSISCLLLTILVAACSPGGDEPPAVTRDASTDAAPDSLAAHVARSRVALAGQVRDECRAALSVPASAEVEVELLGTQSTGADDGELEFRAVVRTEGTSQSYLGRQTFRRHEGAWDTNWAASQAPGGPDEWRTDTLWLGRLAAAARRRGDPPPVEETALGGPFGGKVLPKGGEGTAEEQAVGLKDLDRESPTAYRLLGTADPDAGKSPEEKSRWEWLGTLPDGSLRLVPERAESAGREFTLGAIRFPPDSPAWAAIRKALLDEVQTRLSGRLIEIRKSGEGRYQVQVVSGDWLNLALVQQGLAWVDLTVGGALSDLERRQVLEAQVVAARAGRGLWGVAALATGSWTKDGAALHREGCPVGNAPAEPVTDPFQALEIGTPLCERCLSRTDSKTTHDR